jgi:protein HOOK3
VSRSSYVQEASRENSDARRYGYKNPFEAAEQAYKAQIQALQDEVDRQRTLQVETEQKYQKEQKLMLAAWQENGMDRLRAQVAQNGHAPSRSAPAR